MIQFVNGINLLVPDSGYLRSGNIQIEDNTISTTSGNLILSPTGDVTISGNRVLTTADDLSTSLGSMSTQNANSVAITGGTITGITDLAVADGGTGASNAADARTNLGLVIGTNIQAYDATLAALAGVSTSANILIYATGTDTFSTTSLTAFARSILDDADASATRTTLGLGTIATQDASNVTVTDMTVNGNLTVNGTTTTVNSTTLSVDDKNIELGSVSSPTDVTANGGGITLKGTTDKTLNWSSSSNAWTSSEHFDVASGKAYYINGTSVLNATTLGSGVVASSLTSVGNVATGTWSATNIAVNRGGTGASTAADARTNLGLVIGTNVQAYDATLNALAGVTTSADQVIYATGSDTFTTTSLTSFGRSLIDDADASAARTTLGLVIGTNVQAYDAELAALAELTSAANTLPYFTGSGTAAVTTLSVFGRSLIDDADASAARTTLGLGTSDNPTFNDITVSGNLTVNGTTTTVNSTTLTVDDKNIELGSVNTPTDTTADGGGITLKGTTDKTLNWVNATSAWTSSEHLNVASDKEYRINGTSVLNATTLGSGVTQSSLTSVGNLTQLQVDNINVDENTISVTNTNGVLIISPNGTGSLQADSTGNARGQHAIDWQRSRSSVDQVSSGNYSVIGGGRDNLSSGGNSTVSGGLNNTASGDRSVVGGGYLNNAGAYYSTVVGGKGNSASGLYSFVGGGGDDVVGGSGNVASGFQGAIVGGTNNQAGDYSFVGGGQGNTASGTNSTVGGGQGNTASGYYSTVGGGWFNNASNYASTVSGGWSNSASSYFSTVSGGWSNIASGDYSTVGGGYNNNASGYYSTVSGGNVNSATGYLSVISGGLNNTASGLRSTVGGGYNNNASGYYSTVGGGGGEYANGNTASGNYSFVGGGRANNASGYSSTVSGGQSNTASGYYTTISGGKSNNASAVYSTVSGGVTNTASGNRSAVGGGQGNTASGFDSVIGGGNNNNASDIYSAISGGQNNTASAIEAFVGGGAFNTASGTNSTVSGGVTNTASGSYSTVSGGVTNTASGSHSVVNGGWNNTASGHRSAVGGGQNNTASGQYSTISGGYGHNASRSGSTVGGGQGNTVSGFNSTVSGGQVNNASGDNSTVSGGESNAATANYSTVGGGDSNTSSNIYSTVGGGKSNTVFGSWGTVGGGQYNVAGGMMGSNTVGGGAFNTASGFGWATVGGGNSNTASGASSAVGGGLSNTSSNSYSTVGGGQGNTASGYSSVVSGGAVNVAGGDGSVVGGGFNNTSTGVINTIGGGASNTADGYASTVGGGEGITAAADYSVVGGGANNVASGQNSVIAGGNTNSAGGQNSVISGGHSNVALGENSVIIGGKEAVADRYGMTAFATGKFLAQGDAQRVQFLLRNETTDDTPTNLFLDGSAIPLEIPFNKALFATIAVAGVSDSTNKFAHYVRKVAVNNNNNVVTFIGNVSTIGADTENDAAYDVSISVEDNTLRIIVTGKADETIRWLASVDGIEMSYTPGEPPPPPPPPPPILWFQQGDDIDGSSAGDNAGWGVSLNAAGNVAVIGSPGSSVDGNPDTGRVKVYVWDGTSWTQRGNDIEGENDPNIPRSARSGQQVSINDAGDVIAITAISGYESNIAQRIYTKIYAWNGSSWVQRGDTLSGFGSSASLNSTGNSVAVGNHLYDLPPPNTSAGLVRVYDWNGVSWVQRGQDLTSGNYKDFFGYSVSLNSTADVLAVGAAVTRLVNGSTTVLPRFSRVYEWNGTQWVQRGVNFVDNEYLVSLNADGSILALAHPTATTPNSQFDAAQGRVRVYEWTGSNWVQVGSDIYGVGNQAQSGTSLSLNDAGDVLAIGAYGQNHTRVYTWNGTEWSQQSAAITGEASNDWSGHSVSLNSAGTVLIIGAPLNDDNGVNSGHARIYNLVSP